MKTNYVGFAAPTILPRAINRTWVSYNPNDSRPALFCLKDMSQACGIRFFCPVYQKDIVVVQGNVNLCRDWLYQLDNGILHRFDFNPTKSGYHATIPDAKYVVIWLCTRDFTSFDDPTGIGGAFFALLAHECQHAANHIGWDVGIKYSEDSEEFFTYYSQWLMNNVIDCIGYQPKEDEVERMLPE